MPPSGCVRVEKVVALDARMAEVEARAKALPAGTPAQKQAADAVRQAIWQARMWRQKFAVGRTLPEGPFEDIARQLDEAERQMVAFP